MSFGPLADHAHQSQYYTTMRASTCKGCTVYDDTTIWKQTPILSGTQVVKVTSGNGPSTRTAFYHIECYFKLRNEVMANFLDSSWKVQPERPLKLVVPLVRTWRDVLEDQYDNAPHSNHSFWFKRSEAAHE